MYEYWAAEPDSKKCAAEAIKRIRRYRAEMRRTGRASRIARAWRTNYGHAPDGQGDANMLRPGGEQGELVEMTGNDFSALLTQVVVLITATRPAFKSIATNTDYKSAAQAILADGLQGHYERSAGLGSLDRRVCELALLLSEAWQVQTWNAAAGVVQAINVETGEKKTPGDVEFSLALPWDVAYDPDVADVNALPWFMFRKRALKSDLYERAMRAGDTALAERLCGEEAHFLDDAEAAGFQSPVTFDRETPKDVVDVWELRHLPCEALPTGRLLRFVNADAVILDTVGMDEAGNVTNSGLPYDELHAYAMAPKRVAGSSEPHTPFFDLCAPQEGMDLVASISATAASAGGISNLWTPDGASIAVDQIAGGLNIISSPTEPKPIISVKMDPQALVFGTACLDMMRRRVGLNAAALGDPQKGMPAQAMALMQSQAVQFNSDPQEAWQRYVERSRTGLLKMLQRYAKEPRIASIVGKTNQWALREFTSEDIKDVDRVTIESVNPVSQTMAGKREMLDWLGERGLITDARAAITFLDTGRIEPVYEFDTLNNARIRKDKEMLMLGQKVTPLISDTHWLDIPEYLAVLATPEARTNPEVVTAVTEAVMVKIQMWKAMDPALLMLLKGPPPPVAPPLVGPPGMPQPGQPPPPGGPEKPSQPPAPGLPASAPPVRLPKPPEMKTTRGEPIEMPEGVA